MNKLDGKVLIDRTILENHVRNMYNRIEPFNRDKILAPLKQALAQDNTGWAAVPVVATQEMIDAAYAVDGDKDEAFLAMLAASPPLGGGEE